MALSQIDLEEALTELGRLLREDGYIVDIALFGGAAMILAFEAKRMTRDVDAVVLGEADAKRQLIDKARHLGDEKGWDRDWINDGVKGFVSATPENRFLRSYPSEGEAGLRIFVPSPRYMLAMKLLAMRFDADKSDIDDIRSLAGRVGVQTVEQAVEIVEAFYPRKQIPQKTYFGIEQLFGDHDEP
jgi:hypothetical protein